MGDPKPSSRGELIPFPGTPREALEDALQQKLSGVVVLGIPQDGREPGYLSWSSLSLQELGWLKDCFADALQRRRWQDLR